MERINIITRSYAWKILALVLVIYTIIAGLLIEVPRLPIIEETIRNVFFHVSMWFTMVFLLIISLIYSVRFLATGKYKYDTIAVEAVNMGLFFGILGIVTGMLWARFTWGAYWVRDPKLNGAAVSMLVYLAYIILRASADTVKLRARLSAVYNVFAFVLLIVFIFVLPRIADGSLHPGSGDDSPFAVATMQGSMYKVFFPAIAGWFLMALWFLQIRLRLNNIENLINKSKNR